MTTNEPPAEQETLRELLQSEMDKRGWSQNRLASETERVGNRVTRTTISNIMSGLRITASQRVADAFAVALGIPQDRVYAAASVVADTTEARLVSLHKSLSPEEREVALKMYRTYVRSMRKLQDDQPLHDADPGEAAGS